MKYGFLFIALGIILSLVAFVIIRGWQALPAQGFSRMLYVGLSIALFVAFIATMIFGQKMPLGLASGLSFAGNSYLIILIYLLFSFILADVIRMSNYFVHFAPAGMHSFRFWWMMGSLVVIAVAMIFGNIKFNHPETVSLNIEVAKPKQNGTLKIVAASDLHLGFSIDKKMLRRYVEMINAQKPDIVLLAGDVSDRPIEPLIRQNMEEEFRAIKAPLGVYAIEGNHELYTETPNATAVYLRKSGIVVLQDSVCLVNNAFYIIGRKDYSNPQRKPLSELVANLNPDLPKILLDHQPHHLEEASKLNIDLQISGHTHEGQFFPGNLFVKRMFELGYGYMKKGNTHYYVSSGLGIWGPQYRIGTQSELVVIKMKY